MACYNTQYWLLLKGPACLPVICTPYIAISSVQSVFSPPCHLQWWVAYSWGDLRLWKVKSACRKQSVVHLGHYVFGGQQPLPMVEVFGSSSQQTTYKFCCRLDATLIRQQIPNIPWTYYDTIQMPISDNALVLLGVRWRIGVPDPPRRKPQPTAAKWYTEQFQRFTNTISTLLVTNNDPPLCTARRILSAIAHAVRQPRPMRAQTATNASWSQTMDPKNMVTRVRGNTRATHTETNRQTAPSGSAQIGLFL